MTISRTPKFSMNVTVKRDAMVDRVQLQRDIIKIGSGSNADLRLGGDASRLHAVIEICANGDAYVTDLGNEPCTKLNGSRINRSRLCPGDQVQIGASTINIDSINAVSDSMHPLLADAFSSAAPDQLNPFLKADEPVETGFVMTKAGPDVNADEVENSQIQSLEVMVLWGTNVLHVDHLTPVRDYYVGESETKGETCDYLVPEDKIGCSRLLLVKKGPDGTARVFAPAKSTVQISVGSEKLSLAQALERGLAQVSTSPAGHTIALTAKARVRVDFEGLTFQVGVVAAGRKAKAGLFSRDYRSALFVGLSAVAHCCMLAGMGAYMPNMNLVEEESSHRDQLFLMNQYLKASAEREQEARENTTVDNTNSTQEGGHGERATGSEGSMGKTTSHNTNGRYGIAGPKDNKDVHISKEALRKEAEGYGMIGLLGSMSGGDPNAPTAIWGRDTSEGNDPRSAMGNMFGSSIDEATGAGGLGLSGIGQGGGGRGEGIGIQGIGIGHGAGWGEGQGIGNGRGGFSRGHRAVAPIVRMGRTEASGRLPPEIIQRVVRSNFGRFRACYEGGLRTNPQLQGRVSVRFIIDRGGAVRTVSDGGSDIPDRNVTQCVVRSFYGLSFPEPDSGIVTVVYPIMFTPGG